MGVGEVVTIPAPREARMLSLRCPNSYYAHPKLRCLAEIPEAKLPTLSAIWNRWNHPGRDVNIFKLEHVFVVKEGLVFDGQGRLFDVTRTYHSTGEVAQGQEMVSAAISAGDAKSFKRGILAKSRGSANYGHFVLEMLPRAQIARSFLSLHDWPAIIDSTSPKVENIARQALGACGFSSDLIIATGSAPAFFEELLVVDGLTSHTQYLSPFVMQSLDAIAEQVAEAPKRGIYAPRRPATSRDFLHESEIAAHLGRLGMEEVVTADRSFVEQIAAFKGADTVVGVSGAALTNIVFCKPGTRVFSFTPNSAMEVLFWMIAEARRLDYLEIRCGEFGPQDGSLPWDRAIDISPEEVERIIKPSLY